MSSSEVAAGRSETARPGDQLVVDALLAEGVEHVFGLPGTTVMGLIDRIGASTMRFVSTRHEQVSGFMADGYARVASVPAVCLVSRGPGAANAAIAVQNAHDESVPFVLLVGQVPDALAGRGAFEEMDVVASFRPFSKWVVEVRRTERIPETVQRACRVARSGRPGPVVVSLPLDVLQGEAQAAPSRRPRVHAAGPDPAAVRDVQDLVDRARRPVVVAGGGAAGAPPGALERLAEAWAAPLATTWLRSSLVPTVSPFFFGSLGYGAHDVTEDAVREADLVVSLGCRFSEFTSKRWTLPVPGTAVVQVDIDPDEIGRALVPAVGVVSDAGLAVGALLAEAHRRSSEGSAPDLARRREVLASLRRDYLDAATLTGSTDPAGVDDGTAARVSSAAVVRVLDDLMQDERALLVQDVHSFGPWVARYVRFPHRGSFLGAAGGSMGWGFPAAMGAAVARPDRRVLALCGDGSFGMVMQDFETCVREDIPVVVVVVNNFAYGNTRDRQTVSHGARYSGVFLGNPDFAAFARGLGGHGERVECDAELGPAVRRALTSGRPALVDVWQDPMEGLPDDLRPLDAR